MAEIEDLRKRLGRVYIVDERDWDSARLHAAVTGPSEELLNETVAQALTDSAYFQTWAGWVALWRWIKNHVHPKPAPTPTPSDTHPAWEDLVVLDQGDYGTCVGNGWAGWGDSAPVQDSYDEADARRIYYEATVIDGHPDDPDIPGRGQDGCSVRAGAKAMQDREKLVAYAFATSLADLDEWLDNHGPAVMGTDWYTGMFSPDSRGWIYPTGVVEGGHCFLCVDKLTNEDGYLFVNSWGSGWGLNGRFKMRSSDVARLLAQSGEACLAAEV